MQNEFNVVHQFLHPTKELTHLYPHPTSRLHYEINYRNENFFWGIHPEDMCDQIQLTKQDVIKYEFDMRKFRHTISQILGFQESHEDFKSNDRIISLGTLETDTGQFYHIFLAMTQQEDILINTALRLFDDKISPIILFTPTNRHWSRDVISLCQKRSSMLMSLFDMIEVGDGVLRATDLWRDERLQFIKLQGSFGNIELKPDYEFRKNGQMWIIRYDGNEIFLKDSVGLRCIYHLLAKPNSQIFANELQAIINGRKPNEIIKLTSRDNVADRMTLSEIKQRYSTLQVELEKAKRDNDIIVDNEIKKEIDDITNYLNQATAKNGKTRNISDDCEKARSTISKAFARAVESINKKLPQLAQHLKKYCNVGTTCNYCPENKINWKL
jgi:translation initiation factor 1 (eIF-1/SUI1)